MSEALTAKHPYIDIFKKKQHTLQLLAALAISKYIYV